MTLPCPLPIYSDTEQRYCPAAGKCNCAWHKQIKHTNKHGRPAQYDEEGDELLLRTKNFPADKFKLCKLSPKWTGPWKVLTYQPQNQNLTLGFRNIPDLGNISNTFHHSLLKPFISNDDLHFADSKLNRPCIFEEDQWIVEMVLEFPTQAKSGKPQYKVEW